MIGGQEARRRLEARRETTKGKSSVLNQKSLAEADATKQLARLRPIPEWSDDEVGRENNDAVGRAGAIFRGQIFGFPNS